MMSENVTDEDFKRLENKIDNLTSIMSQINDKLNGIIIIAKEPVASQPQKKKKRGLSDEQVERLTLVLKHQHRLQVQFNLKLPPHESRILAYLKTQDPKIFDGLQRR